MSSQRKTCLITGGSKGIGLSTAERFLDEGYCVCICGRRQATLDEAATTLGREERLLTLCGDVAAVSFQNQIVEATQDRFGSVDVLINNAGTAPLMDFDAIDEATFEDTVDVNIRAVFRLTQLVWPIMKVRGGTIVNISSLAAVDPFPGFSIYGASKAWMETLTRAIADEGAIHRIRVCCVRPGAVETDLLRGLFPDFPAADCVSPQDIADKVFACVAAPVDHPSGESFTVAKP